MKTITKGANENFKRCTARAASGGGEAASALGCAGRVWQAAQEAGIAGH